MKLKVTETAPGKPEEGRSAEILTVKSYESFACYLFGMASREYVEPVLKWYDKGCLGILELNNSSFVDRWEKVGV